MRAFVVILGLVSAAAAASLDKALPDHVHDPPLQYVGVEAVYGASDIKFQLSQEKYGIKALYDMPFVMVFKPKDNKGELLALRLGHGLQTLYEFPELSHIVDASLMGTEYVAFFLSAARTLDLPELKLPLVKKSFYTPESTGMAEVAEDFDALPRVYVVPKGDLPANSLDKLHKLGEFAIYHDKVVLLHDVLEEQAIKPHREVHPSLLPMRDIETSGIDHPIVL